MNRLVNDYQLMTVPQVYCRLRPLQEDEYESCARVDGNTVLQITPPTCSLAYKSGHRNPVSINNCTTVCFKTKYCLKISDTTHFQARIWRRLYPGASI